MPPEDDTSLGAALKRHRLRQGWTQQQCANYFGILKDSYQNYEWNRTIPEIGKRKKINDFLGFNYWDDGSDSLSNRLLCYRIENQITRKALAKQIGVSDSTIERVEKKSEKVSENLTKQTEIFLLESKNINFT